MNIRMNGYILMATGFVIYNLIIFIVFFNIIDRILSPVERMLDGVYVKKYYSNQDTLGAVIDFFIGEVYHKKNIKLQAVYLDDISKNKKPIKNMVFQGKIFYMNKSIEDSYQVKIRIYDKVILVGKIDSD